MLVPSLRMFFLSSRARRAVNTVPAMNTPLKLLPCTVYTAEVGESERETYLEMRETSAREVWHVFDEGADLSIVHSV